MSERSFVVQSINVLNPGIKQIRFCFMKIGSTKYFLFFTSIRWTELSFFVFWSRYMLRKAMQCDKMIDLKLNKKYLNRNLYLIVVLGDSNVKSENWYKHDKMSYEGAKTDALTTQFRLQQIIKEPTYILLLISFSYLIFTSLQNLVMEYRVHSSFHPKFLQTPIKLRS